MRAGFLGLRLGGAFLLGTTSSYAFAQSTEPFDPLGGDQPTASVAEDAAISDPATGEIIVTARKREQRLQDVPASVAVATGEYLRETGTTNTIELARRTPSLVISESDAQAFVFLRGLGSNLQGVGTEGSTGVYLDGVYLPRPSSIIQSFLDVERVEVSRGPQGTLYGQNSVGGAINIISNRPVDSFEASVRGMVGNYDLRQVEGMLNLPMGESIATRLAFQVYDRDGYYENKGTVGPERLGADQNWSGRVSILAQPTPNLEFLLVGDYFKATGDFVPYTVTECAFACSVYGAEIDRNPFRVAVSDDTLNHRIGGGLSLTANLDLGGLTLTSQTAYREYDEDFVQDLDATEVSEFEVASILDQRQFSQELRLSKTGGPVEWLAGLYHFNERSTQDVDIFFGPESVIFGPGSVTLIRFEATNETKVYAAFAEATLHATDRLSITGGLRFSIDQKVATLDQFIGVLPAAPALIGSTPGSREWESWTPNVILAYEVTDEVNTYLKIAKGFKSGGFNGLALQGPFEPETVWSYEGGVKSRLLGGAVTANLALFYYELTNQQISKFVAPTTAIDNAASSQGHGGELELFIRPSQNFDIDVGVAYVDAKYQELQMDDPRTPEIVDVDLSGNSLINAPKWTVSAGSTYRIPVGPQGHVAMHGDLQYRSTTFYDPFNDPAVAQKGFVLVNARVAYEMPTWNIGVFVNNLTNERYVASALRTQSLGDAVLSIYGAPRTWGVQAGIRF